MGLMTYSEHKLWFAGVIRNIGRGTTQEICRTSAIKSCHPLDCSIKGRMMGFDLKNEACISDLCHHFAGIGNDVPFIL